jgi:hypothetical protein
MVVIMTIGRVLQLDPRSWMLGWAIYCAVTGLSLIGPGDVLHQARVYDMLADIQSSGRFWGFAMWVDGATLFSCLFIPSSLFAGMILALSSAFWIGIGIMMIISSSRYDFVSGAGCWCICGGLILLLSTAQLGHRLQ